MYVTEHELLVAVGAPKVHCPFAGVNVPVPSDVKVTVPVGGSLVPLESVSMTVAVHVALVLMGLTIGEQETVVLVARRPTLTG